MNKSVIDEPVEYEIECIQVTQPIGTFYIASINSSVLCEITYADVRRMESEREVETYLGIQRPLKKGRVIEIKEYLTTADACFPTAIILAVDAKCAEFSSDGRVLKLKSYEDDEEPRNSINRLNIAKVLDGQHRIEGLRGYPGKGEFDVNVSIFIDMDIEDQAFLFSTVNLTQTKVHKSLVYDLYEYSKARSPQKTCHNIAVALDALETSPFGHRIKRLGFATKGRFNETLTQATFVEGLLKYFTDNKVADRDLYLRGKTPSRANADELKRLIFRNMFIEEQDISITDVVRHYFEAIRERWPDAWNHGGEGWMLNKTNGFRGMIRLLRPAYLHIANPGEVPSKNEFLKVFSRSKLQDEDFNIEKFKPGTSGETALFRHLLDELGLKDH